MNEHRNEIDPIRVGLIDTKMDANHEDMEFAPNGILYGKNRNGEGIPQMITALMLPALWQR